MMEPKVFLPIPPTGPSFRPHLEISCLTGTL
jgi:hypothetical protein